MPRVSRTFSTDLDDLSYQIARSDAFCRIRADFDSRRITDDEAQGRLADLLEAGHCRFEGDRGSESWEWVLSERESALLLSRLYRDHLGAD